MLARGYTFRLTHGGDLHVIGPPFTEVQARAYEAHREEIEEFALHRLTPMRKDVAEALAAVGLTPKVVD